MYLYSLSSKYIGYAYIGEHFFFKLDSVVSVPSFFVFDAGQMKLVGFDPLDYRVIVLKSANHFRAWWTDVASLIIDSDPPGIGSNDLWSFKFQNKKQKLYPLDKDAVYKA